MNKSFFLIMLLFVVGFTFVGCGQSGRLCLPSSYSADKQACE